VRTEPVSPALWQIVDQWDVAKAILAPPIDAMGLEWIPPIGHKHDQMAPRPSQNPDSFDHSLSVVGQVFQHLMREYNIKGPVPKW
jgi:diadenosine tetraphosphatase ApaH/serine/threonine PP2A family protein phosphatase